jgi:hypothetical protein
MLGTCFSSETFIFSRSSRERLGGPGSRGSDGRPGQVHVSRHSSSPTSRVRFQNSQVLENFSERKTRRYKSSRGTSVEKRRGGWNCDLPAPFEWPCRALRTRQNCTVKMGKSRRPTGSTKKIKGNRYGSGEMGIQISRVMRQNEVILFPMKEENRYCAVWCLLYRFQTTALGESG